MLTTADIEQRPQATSTDRLLAIFRDIGVAVPAGALAGFLAAGVGGRLAMRVSGFMFFQDHPGRFAITENGNRVGEITFGGTMFLIIFGTVLGIMGAYFYVGLKPWLPGPTVLRGLLFGIILLLVLSLLSVDPANEDFQRFGSPAVNVILFSMLFVCYGLLIAPFDAWLGRRLPGKLAPSRDDLNPRSVVGYLVLLGGVAFGLLLFQMLLLVSFISVLGGENMAERLRGGALVAAVLILLPAYFLLPPVAQAGGYRAAYRHRPGLSSAIGGGALLVLLAGILVTTTSIFSIVTG